MSRLSKLTRGATLVVVLLLLGVLLVLGLGLITEQVHLYGASNEAQLAVQARALAEAGLEDARAKLEKDLGFPPDADPLQKIFTYSEVMTDMDGTVVGQYTVTVDTTHLERNEIIAVTSVGRTGATSAVNRVLYAELDLSGDVSTNPNFFQFVHFEDRE